MPTYTFTGPKVTAKRTGQCPTCGKRTTRTQTFEHTVNPFNTTVGDDGVRRPKTWDEVRADVRAEADAWTPGPEVFEHDKCRAERTAPPRAEPIPVPAERLLLASRVRAAMGALAEFTREHGLPLGCPTFTGRGSAVADVSLPVPPGEVVAWARALGFAELRVFPERDATHITIKADLPEVTVVGHTWISKPDGRDPLGGAPVEWRHDSRGRKSSGTVTVDALAKGLAVMGIAVVNPELFERPGGDQ